MKAKVNIQVGKAPSLHLAYKIRKWCPKQRTAASECCKWLCWPGWIQIKVSAWTVF